MAPQRRRARYLFACRISANFRTLIFSAHIFDQFRIVTYSNEALRANAEALIQAFGVSAKYENIDLPEGGPRSTERFAVSTPETISCSGGQVVKAIGSQVRRCGFESRITSCFFNAVLRSIESYYQLFTVRFLSVCLCSLLSLQVHTHACPSFLSQLFGHVAAVTKKQRQGRESA